MKFQPIKQLLLLAVAATLLVLGACASGPDVRVNVDSSIDFSQYHTFAFESPLGTDRNGSQSIVSQQLKAATQRELEARGLRLDDKAPQLLLNFNANLNDKMRVSTTPSTGVTGGYYGYRAGRYSAWPQYQDQTTVTQYTEGTLNIDVVDAARRQMVWESVVADSLSKKDMASMPAVIDAAVAAAFAKFPIGGGR